MISAQAVEEAIPLIQKLWNLNHIAGVINESEEGRIGIMSSTGGYNVYLDRKTSIEVIDLARSRLICQLAKLGVEVEPPAAR